MECDCDKVIRELRAVQPSAARVVEMAVELLGTKELTWGLVVLVAAIAGKSRDETTATLAALDGMVTRTK